MMVEMLWGEIPHSRDNACLVFPCSASRISTFSALILIVFTSLNNYVRGYCVAHYNHKYGYCQEFFKNFLKAVATFVVIGYNCGERGRPQ